MSHDQPDRRRDQPDRATPGSASGGQVAGDITVGFRADLSPPDAAGGQAQGQAVEEIDFLARFLRDLDATPSIRECHRRVRDLARLLPGDCVLDVGCGLGFATRRLAEAVTPGGRAVGIDTRPEFLAAAHRDTPPGLPVAWQVADALSLPFPDATFDVVQCERVLMYLDRPAAAISEMVRVLKPGGRLVVWDLAQDAHTIDHPDDDLVRRITRVLADQFPSPHVGRQLPRLFAQAGLSDVTPVPSPLAATLPLHRTIAAGGLERAVESGQLTPADVATWWAGLSHADQHGHFLATYASYVTSGRKA